jgi:4'-phosphopantetheinyl transferase
MTDQALASIDTGLHMETYWLEQSEADLPAHDDWLSAEETVLLSCMHFAKRRADWRLGRWTAKCAAAAYLNIPSDSHSLRQIEVRAAASGAPELFLADLPAAVTISISHRSGIALCAIASGGVQLGCDLELIERRDPSFVADYLTNAEQNLISRAADEHRSGLVTLLWSAKESALKAMREGLRVDTRRVEVSLETDPADAVHPVRQWSGSNRWRRLQVCNGNGEVFHGWWHSAETLVGTLVGAPAPLQPLFLRVGLSN